MKDNQFNSFGSSKVHSGCRREKSPARSTIEADQVLTGLFFGVVSAQFSDIAFG